LIIHIIQSFNYQQPRGTPHVCVWLCARARRTSLAGTHRIDSLRKS